MSAPDSIWTTERQELALAEAEHWLGVPHCNRMATFPVGVDCIHYVAEILFASGILERRQLPFYNVNVGIATESRELQDQFIALTHVEELPASTALEFGDIPILITGNYAAHCGFYANGNFYHALAGRCVTCSRWSHWQHRLASIMRVSQEGWT